jgi:hypothetical protein
MVAEARKGKMCFGTQKVNQSRNGLFRFGHVRSDKRIVARFQAWQQAPGKPNKVLWPGQSKFSRHKGTFFVRQVIMDVYV